jgi:hypothetical protein
VVTRVTTEQLGRLAKAEGFEIAETKGDMVKLKDDLVTVYFFVADEGKRVACVLPLKGTKATAKRVNAFNAKPSSHFTAALGDGAGEVFLKGGLDVEGGVTERTVARFLAAFMRASPRFILEVCD